MLTRGLWGLTVVHSPALPSAINVPAGIVPGGGLSVDDASLTDPSLKLHNLAKTYKLI